MIRTFVLTAVSLLLSFSTALANYQVTGRFLYRDREFNLNGFTGNDPTRPIRLADVEVVDANTQQVIGEGVTDQNGDFSISVIDNQVRNVTVRALTSSSRTTDLHITVRHRNNSAIYAIAHPTFDAHPPTQNIDFSANPVVAEPSPTAVGDAFNIFDVTLDAMDFLAVREGARPAASQALTLYWALGNGNGTFYSHASRSIYLVGILSVDSDGYDDSVILHEVGHYMEFNFSDSDNPGGNHAVNVCHNLPLAWSEGWATFFQNMVRDWQGLNRPDYYVDTDGRNSGTGGAFLSYAVESLGFTTDKGSGNEATVNAVLWDLVDDSGTLDGSPGIDDDAFGLTDGVTRVWDVFANYLPTASTISIEDFYDGWLSRGHGMQGELQTLFDSWSMEYDADPLESDNSAAQARVAGVASGTTHHTIFGVGDQDWTRFAGVAGGIYDFRTQNQPCGSNARLELRDSNGTTILATNDATNSGDDRIQWVANKNGALYLRVTRSNDGHAYASYDLVVDIQVPVALFDFSVSSTAAGLVLQWHAEQQGGFSHFDVERADAVDGPFQQVNSERILHDPSDSTLYRFADTTVDAGRSYFYRIVGVESSGERTLFGPYPATAAAPAHVLLHPARPNPFNPSTTLSFDLPQQGLVDLHIFDTAGRLVRTLVQGESMPAGTRSVHWDGLDNDRRQVSSGVYLVQLDAMGDRQAQRVVLVR